MENVFFVRLWLDKSRDFAQINFAILWRNLLHFARSANFKMKIR